MDFKLTGLTLKEALDMTFDEGDMDVSQIYIEPPESHLLTDEDSVDEDVGGIPDNLNPRQLCAGAEIVFSNSERIGDFESDPVQNFDTGENSDAVSSNGGHASLIENAEITMEPIAVSVPEHSTYIDGDLINTAEDFPLGDYSKYSSMSCVELFELFFTSDLCEKIISETQNYAFFKNEQDPNISVSELKVFIAILVLSGYNQLPSKRTYWENSSDMKNILVSDAMRRDRFLQICHCIHFANNNTIDKNDKMYKLRPLTDSLKKMFLENFIPEQNLAYDESMIRYFGHHGCKQFIRGKPVRFGYKVWCLNTPSGYLINFEIYQGKNPRSNPHYQSVFGKAAAPMVQMIEELNEKRLLHYNFFFDNLFTGENLLSTLKINGYGATGTVRDNRIPKNCPLVAKKAMEKKSRGEYSNTLNKESGILYVRWKDNSVVTVASTCFGVQPLKPVERFSKKEGRVVPVPRPYLISKYNQSMGGTDQMDNNISSYRIAVRSKKWYWPIFTYLIDAAIQNAWILYRKSGRNIGQLEFRRNICQSYLTIHKTEARKTGRIPNAAGSDFRVSDTVRFDCLNHWIIPVPDGKRRRCAMANCISKGRTMCSKCNVGLCVTCFKSFHTNGEN